MSSAYGQKGYAYQNFLDPRVSNPTYVQGQSNHIHRAPKEPEWNAEHIVHVDSGMRNSSYYPLASDFQLQCSKPYEDVMSVELLNVNLPINQVPTGGYLFIICPQLELLDTLVPTQGGTANTTGANAFAKIDINVSAGSRQLWRKSEVRFRKQFKSPMGTLQRLQFQVVDSSGTPYEFPQGEDWSATLSIMAKN